MLKTSWMVGVASNSVATPGHGEYMNIAAIQRIGIML
jgi:hypothetical protein